MIRSSARKNLRILNIESEEAHENVPVTPNTVNCAIELNNVTVQYPIGPYVRGSIKASLFKLFGHRDASPPPTYVEAVRGLSMTIDHGERVGIIGRNGSGKSTLLRTLAGIYPIKAGTARVLGRIGTLLDIGLGFETESTGRENIYYRGMAMGLSRGKLAKVEQEIIDFAGLGQFIDLPMRTYSAGMYVRLGFAISTQIDPDVLLIDEIFGAGDAAFAAKAEKRMMNIVKHAGIVVLVTHDLRLVERLCTRVIWLEQGVVRRDGPASVVVPQFLKDVVG
jgi:lipopolysaccharide transport system ATP-binding protein